MKDEEIQRLELANRQYLEEKNREIQRSARLAEELDNQKQLALEQSMQASVSEENSSRILDLKQDLSNKQSEL